MDPREVSDMAQKEQERKREERSRQREGQGKGRGRGREEGGERKGRREREGRGRGCEGEGQGGRSGGYSPQILLQSSRKSGRGPYPWLQKRSGQVPARCDQALPGATRYLPGAARRRLISQWATVFIPNLD